MTTNRPLTLRMDSHADALLIAGWVCDERGDEQYFEVVQPATSKEAQWITAQA